MCIKGGDFIYSSKCYFCGADNNKVIYRDFKGNKIAVCKKCEKLYALKIENDSQINKILSWESHLKMAEHLSSEQIVDLFFKDCSNKPKIKENLIILMRKYPVRTVFSSFFDANNSSKKSD